MSRRCAFLAVALAILCAGRSSLADEAARPILAPEMQRIVDRGRLVVAVAGFDLAPFVVTEADGRVAGYDIGLAKGMAKALGVSVEFNRQARTPDEVIDIVARGDADIGLSRLSTTLDRAMRIRFSRPYLVLHQALLLNRLAFAQNANGRDPIEVAKAPGAMIAIRRGTDYGTYARRLLPGAQLRTYADWQPDIIDAVISGEVTAGYGDELEVKRVLAQREDAPLRLRIAVLSDARDPIAAALPWGSAQLLAWVDLYLENAGLPATADDFLAKDANNPPPE